MPSSFLGSMNAMPKSRAIIVGFGVGCVAAALCIGMTSASANRAPTLTNDWRAANKEYMKFQNNNPISGVSRTY